LTPGHSLETWYHPSHQAVLRNCIEWCKRVAG
jgi:trehalose utilization protein